MINWSLTEQEADYVLKCLQQRPFVEVNGLIQKLVQQANPQKAQQELPGIDE